MNRALIEHLTTECSKLSATNISKDHIIFNNNNKIDKQAAEIERLKASLKEIKLTALTATKIDCGLSHIVRVCIDAGITEKLDELKVKGE